MLIEWTSVTKWYFITEIKTVCHANMFLQIKNVYNKIYYIGTKTILIINKTLGLNLVGGYAISKLYKCVYKKYRTAYEPQRSKQNLCFYLLV